MTTQLDVAHNAFGDPDPFADAASDLDSPPDKPPGPRTRARIAGGVAAAVIGVGGFFGVGALASHTKTAMVTTGAGGPGGFGGFGAGGPGGGGVSGTIKSVNGSSLVLTTSSGSTETVTTTAATVVTKAVTGSLSDVRTGDHVVVTGAGTTTVAASSIADSGRGGALPGGRGGPPGGVQTAFLSGTVGQVGNASLIVTESGGAPVNVTTSSSTAVTNMQSIDVAALTAGQQVRVTGSTSNGAITATAVQEGVVVGPGGLPGQGAPPVP